VSFALPGGNGEDSGIAGWENMGIGFKFRMGMGMKSLKWEGIGTKNLFPHTSTTHVCAWRRTTLLIERLLHYYNRQEPPMKGA